MESRQQKQIEFEGALGREILQLLGKSGIETAKQGEILGYTEWLYQHLGGIGYENGPEQTTEEDHQQIRTRLLAHTNKEIIEEVEHKLVEKIGNTCVTLEDGGILA